MHHKMNENRFKDESVMKLLNVLKNKGIDVEGIYNENVRTPSSNGEQEIE